MEFRILGPLEVVVADVPLSLGGPRQQRFLAVLLLHAGRIVTTEHLVDCLWPGQPPVTAASQVRNCAAALRRVLTAGGLPAGALTRRTAGYQIRLATGALDRTRFDEQARLARYALTQGRTAEAVDGFRQAESLWRGPAIAGLADGALEPDAMSMNESRLQVVEDRIEAELTLGRNAHLVPELVALARAHPGRDRLQAALLISLVRGGRPTDALITFDRLRNNLRTELGLEPSRRLRELRQAILIQDDALLGAHHV
jgi:DNA-binding SARP family transcriptional activator